LRPDKIEPVFALFGQWSLSGRSRCRYDARIPGEPHVHGRQRL